MLQIQKQQQQQHQQKTNILLHPVLQKQQQQIPQLSKQVSKPVAMESNIHKLITQQKPNNQTSSFINTSQPLKLLSSLTNMVNNTSASVGAGLSINRSSTGGDLRSQQLKSVPAPGMSPAASIGSSSIQPILMQLAAAQQQKNKDMLTREQLVEFQKAYAKQLAASKISTSTVPNAVQLGSTSLAINTKIPIQTVPSAMTKSAFATTKLKTKIPGAFTGNSNLLNLTQAQVNQLAQQGLILSPKPQLLKTQQQVNMQSAAVTQKLLQEHLKGLSPIQRDLLIKQYSTSVAGKQIQSALSSGAASNPALLASILKNRQNVQTILSTPKRIITSSSIPSMTPTQIVKKGPKVFYLYLLPFRFCFISLLLKNQLVVISHVLIHFIILINSHKLKRVT